MSGYCDCPEDKRLKSGVFCGEIRVERDKNSGWHRFSICPKCGRSGGGGIGQPCNQLLCKRCGKWFVMHPDVMRRK